MLSISGLTLLLPYIISTRRNWNTCKLRVFALANKNSELEFEQRSMASLLSKFRIDYSDLILLPDIIKKPEETTVAFFNGLIKNFVSTNNAGHDCECFFFSLCSQFSLIDSFINFFLLYQQFIFVIFILVTLFNLFINQQP